MYITQGSGQEHKVAVVDTKKKRLLTEIGGSYRGSNLRMTPDGKRVYASSNGLSPGNTNGFWLGGEGKPGTS